MELNEYQRLANQTDQQPEKGKPRDRPSQHLWCHSWEWPERWGNCWASTRSG